MNMIRFAKDYAATVRANKVLAIGYGLLATSIALGAQNVYNTRKLESAVVFAGTPLIGLTAGGAFTLRTIRRTRAHIERHGTIDERFQNRVSTFYCGAAGVEYVAKEYGLDDILTSDILKRTTIADCAKTWAIPAAAITAAQSYNLYNLLR
ncbi:TPA: hypothetical protein HA251_06140 [Candidatus Woesearchaeota archaeon]|nr:hypothetical protein [Candidatus Woesearchaeota archaeon]